MWDSNETTCVIRVRDAAAFGEHHLLKCLVRAKISPFGGKNPLSGWNQSCRRSLAILEAASWSSFYSITVINKELSPYLSVYLFLTEIYTHNLFFYIGLGNLDDLFPNLTLLCGSVRMQNYFSCISLSITSKYYFYIGQQDWSLKLHLPLWTLSHTSQPFLNALRKESLPTS